MMGGMHGGAGVHVGGLCVAGEKSMWGMCGAWHAQQRGMCGMHGRGDLWQGACMAGGMHATHAPLPTHYEIWSVNAWNAYWNAFLLTSTSTSKADKIEH